MNRSSIDIVATALFLGQAGLVLPREDLVMKISVEVFSVVLHFCILSVVANILSASA